MSDLFEYNPTPWSVRVCRDSRHNVNSYDICLPSEPDAASVGVVASVYVGEEIANLIAAAPRLYETLDVLLNCLDREAVARLGIEQEVLAAVCALQQARGETND